MVTAVEPEHSDPHTILNLLPHGVLVVGADWRILYANPEATRMVGASGATLWDRCPELEHTAFGSGFRYAMADRTELLTESALPRVGWTQARARPTPDGGLLISLRQVNPHMLESGQAKQVLMMGEIGDAMTREESLHSALQRCTTAMVRHLEASVARVWTIDPGGRILELCASAGLTDTLIGHQQSVMMGEHKIGQIAEDGEPYLTNDVATDPHVGGSEWVKRERISAFAGYPLRVEERIVGVMAMYSRRPLDHDVLNALSSSVDLMALGIARKTADSARRRAEATLRAQAERLEILYELSKRLSAELDVTPLAQELIDTATRLAGADVGAFFYQLPGTVGPELTSYTVSGVPRDAFAKMAMPRLTPLLAPSFSGGKSVRFDDLRDEDIHGKLPPHFGMPPGHPTVVSYLSVPVLARAGRRVGVIVLGHGKPAKFGPDTERLIASMASTAAISMDNATLFQEARGLISALEKSNAELDQFAYVASHDLKAPLRGIANISQWIEDDLGDKMDDQARDHLQLLRGRVLRLENLIAGILAYSRAGRERSDIVDIDVKTVATEVWELLAPPATAKLVLGDNLPRLSTQRVQFQQVLLNLIGNAIKYNPGREVTIQLTATREEDMWNIAVADNGIGVPAEFHERIWGLFQTLERRDKVESTGIGLSVVRKIVESQHGRTWVENPPGGGAAFHFTWPVMKGDTHG